MPLFPGFFDAWRHLAAGIEQMMRLSDVMALQPGSRILLNAALGAPVVVRCGAVPLFEGRVGRRKSRIAVRIERDLPRLQQTER